MKKIKILEGTKIYTQEGICEGVLSLQEGERSDPMIIIESAEFTDLQETTITENEKNRLSELQEAAGGRRKGILLAMEGRFQMADVQNRNKRIYPDTLWNKVLEDDGKWTKRVRENKMLGECDHPKDGQTLLNRVSHMVTRLYRNPNNSKEILGRLVVFDTEKGRILKAIHEGGGRLGVSSRGKGSVVRQDGFDIVQEDFDLDTFDVVHNPSTPDAYPDVFTEAVTKKENTEMSGRLQDLKERLARYVKHDVSKLEGAALEVISEEVEGIKDVLTTESFGDQAPQAAVLAVEASNYLTKLGDRKALVESASVEEDRKKDDILGEPGKNVSHVKGKTKDNMLGMESEDDDDEEDDDKDKQKNESTLMEPGFVKSDSDEKLWGKAKRAAKHAGAEDKHAFANWWFHKQKNESVETTIPRPKNGKSVRAILEGLEVTNSKDSNQVAKTLSENYRKLFDIDGRLEQYESQAIQIVATDIVEQEEKLEETKPTIKARIFFGSVLNESEAEEITASSEADLRRSVEERTKGRNTGLVFVEVDRSESIYKECADRFNPLLESQTVKAVLTAQEAGRAKAQLTEMSAKMSAAQQILESLAAQVRASNSNLDEVRSEAKAAQEILEALVQEFGAERLRGTVEGIASTHPSLDGLAETLSEADNSQEAISKALRLLSEKTSYIRESLPGRNEKIDDALDANAAMQKQLLEEKRRPAPKQRTSTGQGAITERTNDVVTRMQALGGR